MVSILDIEILRLGWEGYGTQERKSGRKHGFAESKSKMNGASGEDYIVWIREDAEINRRIGMRGWRSKTYAAAR